MSKLIEIKKYEMVKIGSKMCFTCTSYHDNSCKYYQIKELIGCLRYTKVDLD